MPDYTVNMYREMRVKFNAISADTPEQAADIARDKPTSEADAVEDCDGRDLHALVEHGDDETIIDIPHEGIAPHFAQAMQGMLQAAVDHWGEAVRNDKPINGGDAVQWLSGFITAAAPLLRAAKPVQPVSNPPVPG